MAKALRGGRDQERVFGFPGVTHGPVGHHTAQVTPACVASETVLIRRWIRYNRTSPPVGMSGTADTSRWRVGRLAW